MCKLAPARNEGKSGDFSALNGGSVPLYSRSSRLALLRDLQTSSFRCPSRKEESGGEERGREGGRRQTWFLVLHTADVIVAAGGRRELNDP